MNKTWLIAKQEYIRHVFRKRFLLVLLGMPFFLLLIAGVGMLVGVMQIDRTPIGVIDPSGYLDQEAEQLAVENQAEGIWVENPLLFLDQESRAAEMLEQDELQAYYILPAEYPNDRKITLVAKTDPSSDVRTALTGVLQQRMLREIDPTIKARLTVQPDIIIHSLESDRKQSSQQWYAFMIPIFSGILFILVVNTSGGYLLRAVVEEKENRTMEILLTSVSSSQLMSGKIYGNLSVGLTQLIFWFGLPMILYWILAPVLLSAFDLQLDPQFLILTAGTLLPAFVLVAALMAALGATVTETQEAQQVAGLFTLPMVAPYWFMSLIMMNPNSAFSIGLSLFPLTAPVTLPLRAVFTDVPLWQSGLSIVLLVISAYGAVRMAGSVFRLGMLRYGKRLTLKEVVRGLRHPEAA